MNIKDQISIVYNAIARIETLESAESQSTRKDIGEEYVNLVAFKEVHDSLLALGKEIYFIQTQEKIQELKKQIQTCETEITQLQNKKEEWN